MYSVQCTYNVHTPYILQWTHFYTLSVLKLNCSDCLLSRCPCDQRVCPDLLQEDRGRAGGRRPVSVLVALGPGLRVAAAEAAARRGDRRPGRPQQLEVPALDPGAAVHVTGDTDRTLLSSSQSQSQVVLQFITFSLFILTFLFYTNQSNKNIVLFSLNDFEEFFKITIFNLNLL